MAIFQKTRGIFISNFLQFYAANELIKLTKAICSCWTGQNFHEIACEATRSDNFASKSSFYRPFSDDESLPKGFGGGTNRRGSPRLSDLRFSREEQELEASPSPPESVSVSSDFPPPSDERLTAALGLISLCRSKFPGEKLPNGECDPGVVLSTREDEGCGTADRKNIPQLEMRTSEHLLREANAEASGSKGIINFSAVDCRFRRNCSTDIF